MEGHTAQILALASALAWASGINVYAAILVLGILKLTGLVALPHELDTLATMPVIATAAVLFAGQFIADKIPGVDTLWDSVHTFIRVPAGAFLAAATLGDADAALKVAAALAGGALSLGTHATKAGGRLFVNSHIPIIGTIAASLGEDVLAIGGLFLAATHPAAFLGLLVLAIVAMAVLLWWLAKFVAFAARKVAGLFGTHAAAK
ncbi:MAG: DUF4126 family protein [Alphaproteobacteria bacterium]|nr:DUF4126 family protein [Alphaproteobacteria bacterium]